jgi:hypothetical protein
VTCLLKAGISEPEEMYITRLQQPKPPAIAKQRRCKHVYAATEADATVEKLLEKKQATMEELLEAVSTDRRP